MSGDITMTPEFWFGDNAAEKLNAEMQRRVLLLDKVWEWALNSDPGEADLAPGWLAAQETLLAILRGES